VKGLAPFIRIFHLQKSISPAPPGGHFSLANFSPNFSQKFDQKLASNPGGHFSLDYEEVYRQPHPEGSFYSIFCEKIVVQPCNNSDTPNFFDH